MNQSNNIKELLLERKNDLLILYKLISKWEKTINQIEKQIELLPKEEYDKNKKIIDKFENDTKQKKHIIMELKQYYNLC